MGEGLIHVHAMVTCAASMRTTMLPFAGVAHVGYLPGERARQAGRDPSSITPGT